MRRYTGVRAATNSVENVDFPGAEVFNIAEGGNGVTVLKGEVMLYLAVCVTGARTEGTTW